jgi:hypothetical protein
MKYLPSIHWRFAVAALAVAMGVYVTVTPPPGGAMGPPAAPYRATAAKLDGQLLNLTCAGERFDAVLKIIERDASVKINLDRESLAAAALDPRRLVVTTRLRAVRVRTALEVVLADADTLDRLRFFVADDGTIMVTTTAGDAKRSMTRTYDVSDLVDRNGPAGRAALAKDLTTLIMETVAPESWVSGGGQRGSITVHGVELVIRQTPENIRLVEEALEQLRSTRALASLFRRVQEDSP